MPTRRTFFSMLAAMIKLTIVPENNSFKPHNMLLTMAAGFNWNEDGVQFDFGEQESSATRVGIIAWTDIQKM